MRATVSRVLVLLVFLGMGPLAAAPSVYPSGVTINDGPAAWGGYTVLSLLGAPYVAVIDMQGRTVKTWDGFNTSAGGPARVYPGGQVIAPTGGRQGFQESLALIAQDFSGKELWRLDRIVRQPSGGPNEVMPLRQHHDWQRNGYSAEYYSPSIVRIDSPPRTLVLAHESRNVPAIGPGPIQDDHLIELDENGRILWEWRAGDHIDEFGFDEDARAAIRTAAAPAPPRGGGAGGAPRGGGAGTAPRGGGAAARGGGAGDAPRAGGGAGAAPAGGADAPQRGFDWVHINSAGWLGPNKWFDAGDSRFAPDNVIISSRSASFVVIIARDGRVVWRLGPDVRETPEQLAIGQIIGQHHAHIIPKGLPGEGNMLIFDNGGSSGYGTPSPIAPRGVNTLARATSRVLEIDPVTMRRVWTYTAGANFFSTNISGAQRLPNGNTLITEGAPGRVFEVNSEGTVVWEYINAPGDNGRRGGIYRAYRVPYEWIPQLPGPAATN